MSIEKRKKMGVVKKMETNKAKKAFISGITGQDGSYLSEFLLDKGYVVYGLIRRSSTDTTERIAHVKHHPNFHLVEGDVTDAACIHRLISGIKPDEVYNLAAMSHVGTSFDQPIATCHIDALGPLHLLEAIRQSSPHSKFYQASTSELVGDTSVVPQNEDTPFNPNSPYAVAKLYAHHMVGLYRRAYGIFACAGILYNHESNRRGEAFVTRKITKYVAMIQNWINTHEGFPVKDVDVAPLLLGNLEAKRDWGFAGDYVKAMWLMLQQDKPKDYIVASGESHSILEFLDLAFSHIKLDYRKFIKIDPKFLRPSDVNLLCGDSTKIRLELGWFPEVSFERLVSDMVDSDIRLYMGAI